MKDSRTLKTPLVGSGNSALCTDREPLQSSGGAPPRVLGRSKKSGNARRRALGFDAGSKGIENVNDGIESPG